jgi:hypothetical protein
MRSASEPEPDAQGSETFDWCRINNLELIFGSGSGSKVKIRRNFPRFDQLYVTRKLE